MPIKPALTTTQFLLRIQKIGHGGLIDLAHLDLRQIDMQDKDVLPVMQQIASRNAHGSPETHIYIDLTKSDISGLDLSNYSLTDFIMSGVTAEKTIFTGADLSDTKLDDANVCKADFRNANLSFTKLYGSNITGANFSGANMQTTYGFNFAAPDEHTIKSLAKASSIKEAKFPPKVEELRKDIESRINNKNTATNSTDSDARDN